jgi:ankyrin repeat protein
MSYSSSTNPAPPDAEIDELCNLIASQLTPLSKRNEYAPRNSILAMFPQADTSNMDMTKALQHTSINLPESSAMPGPRLPLELLLMVAQHMKDATGDVQYRDLNSFLRVNSVLHECLNPVLWRSATKKTETTARVLTYLINTNNVSGLAFFLELGADVNTPLSPWWQMYARGRTYPNPVPLIVVAHLDNVSMARLLLEHGAKVVPHSTEHGAASSCSAMHSASSAEMVQLLLDHGADINQTDGYPHLHTPLHYNIVRKNFHAMRVLLEKGAEIEAWGLLVAAAVSKEALKVLFEHGADPATGGAYGETPLHVAAGVGKIDIVRFLLERWPDSIRAKDNKGETPLHYAARRGRVKVVRLLVGLWPEGRQEKDDRGWTPLMRFAEKKYHVVDGATWDEMFALLELPRRKRRISDCN